MSPTTWVNLTHPSQQYDKKNRYAVAVHAARHARQVSQHQAGLNPGEVQGSQRDESSSSLAGAYDYLGPPQSPDRASEDDSSSTAQSDVTNPYPTPDATPPALHVAPADGEDRESVLGDDENVIELPRHAPEQLALRAFAARNRQSKNRAEENEVYAFKRSHQPGRGLDLTAVRYSQRRTKTSFIPRAPEGPPHDPFGVYPIKSDDFVHRAVDKWLHLWAPLQSPEGRVATHNNPLVAALFPLALHNPHLFETVVTLGQSMYEASRGVKLGGDNPESKMIFLHQGRAIKNMREKLSNPGERVDEATVVTVMQLTAVELIFGEVESFKSHSRGLHQMVKVMGGFSDSPLHRIIEPYFLASKFYVAMMDYQSSTTALPTPESLTYPKHPYSPSLCLAISALSDGFGELALRGVLSIQIISLLQRTSSWSSFITEEKPLVTLSVPWEEMELAVRCLQVLSSKEDCPSVIQRCICFALLSVLRQSRSAYGVFQRVASDFLSAVRTLVPRTNAEHDFYIWICFVAVRGSSNIPHLTTLAWQIMDDLLQNYEQTRNWKQLELILRKFWRYGYGKKGLQKDSALPASPNNPVNTIFAKHEACWRTGMDRRIARLKEVAE